MYRRWAAAVLAALLALGLGGCWDRRELEETAFVLALGLDRDQKTGELLMSTMVAIPNKMAGAEGGGGGEEDKVMVTTAAVRTVLEGLNLMDTYLDRMISLEHTKVLILSRSLVEQSGLATLLDPLARYRPLRRTIPVMISDQSSEELLTELQPVLERDPNRYLEFLPFTSRHTGLSPARTDLHELLTYTENPGIEPVAYLVALQEEPGRLNAEGAAKEGARPTPGAAGGEGEGSGSGGGGGEGEGSGGGGGGGAGEEAGKPPMPRVLQPDGWVPGRLPRRGGPNLEMAGAAVFRDGRMVGTMTGQESRMLNLLRGRFRRAFLAMDDPLAPGRQISLELRAGQPPRYQTGLSGERVAITVWVPVEVEVQGIESEIDYTQPNNQRVLEQAIRERLEQDMNRLVERAQQEWRSDVIGLGLQAARFFPTYQDWVTYDWEARFPEAEVGVRVQVSLRRFGMQLAPPQPERGTGGR